jgi:chromosome segregation ATPase
MAFKFFRMKEADARIVELEASVASLTKERDAAVAAVGENHTEITAQAEVLKKDLAASVADLTTAKQTIGSLETQIKSLESMNADQTKSIEAKGKEVDAKVAAQVASVQAALGSPAAPSAPTSASAPAHLTGMDRVRAAARADLEKAGYVGKN